MVMEWNNDFDDDNESDTTSEESSDDLVKVSEGENKEGLGNSTEKHSDSSITSLAGISIPKKDIQKLNTKNKVISF